MTIGLDFPWTKIILLTLLPIGVAFTFVTHITVGVIKHFAVHVLLDMGQFVTDAKHGILESLDEVLSAPTSSYFGRSNVNGEMLPSLLDTLIGHPSSIPDHFLTFLTIESTWVNESNEYYSLGLNLTAAKMIHYINTETLEELLLTWLQMLASDNQHKGLQG
jgi:hypothetical protein